jgi:hypothetical protein
MFGLFIHYLQGNPTGMEGIASLKYIFLAGEALPPVMIEQFKKMDPGGTIRLENIYGPTEGTIYASYYSLQQWQPGMNIPIGKPLHNISLEILDAGGKRQPIGIPGQLHISGAGVTPGYLNRPELTHNVYRSFKFNGTNETYRIYGTGDLAMWLPDGNIAYMGRIDNQVKIRGFRVELGEIESHLLNHPTVTEAVVLARKEQAGGENYLCAYVCGSDIDTSVLKEYLVSRLPGYMVPGHFVTLEAMPLTPGGKLDRQSLLGLESSRVISRAAYAAPGSPTEHIIATVWQGILNLENPGIDDNFFDLGGNSFDIMKIAAKLNEQLPGEQEIPIVKMFKYPSIRTLARFVDEGETICFDEHETNQLSVEKARAKNRLKERARRKKSNQLSRG